jgi:hypothetical protein
MQDIVTTPIAKEESKPHQNTQRQSIHTNKLPSFLNPLIRIDHNRILTSTHGSLHSLLPTAARSQFSPIPVHVTADPVYRRGSNQCPLLLSRKHRSDQ